MHPHLAAGPRRVGVLYPTSRSKYLSPLGRTRVFLTLSLCVQVWFRRVGVMHLGGFADSGNAVVRTACALGLH